MSRIETSSRTGQGEPPPPKDERDAAFSSGGGRTAEGTISDRDKTSDKAKPRDKNLVAPIGLEMETRAGVELHESPREEALEYSPGHEDDDCSCSKSATPRPSMNVTHTVIHRSPPKEAAATLMSVAENLESQDKVERAQKIRDVAAKITLQEQNEIDGFPIDELK